MSGHRKFSELTKHFTPEDRKIIEEKKGGNACRDATTRQAQ